MLAFLLLHVVLCNARTSDRDNDSVLLNFSIYIYMYLGTNVDQTERKTFSWTLNGVCCIDSSVFGVEFHFSNTPLIDKACQFSWTTSPCTCAKQNLLTKWEVHTVICEKISFLVNQIILHNYWHHCTEDNAVLLILDYFFSLYDIKGIWIQTSTVISATFKSACICLQVHRLSYLS